jgi:hypothetical protein
MPATKAQASNRPAQAPTGEARYRWIAHAAYLRAEKRGFAPGQEVDDWLCRRSGLPWSLRRLVTAACWQSGSGRADSFPMRVTALAGA